MQLELGGDAKTAAATTLAGPVEIRLRRRIRHANLRPAVDHGDLLQAIAGETMRARQQPMAAAEDVPGDADGRTASRLQREALCSNGLIDLIERGAGTGRDDIGRGVDGD